MKTDGFSSFFSIYVLFSCIESIRCLYSIHKTSCLQKVKICCFCDCGAPFFHVDICCFSNGFLRFFTHMILTNVSNSAIFGMKLPYFKREISKFAPKPCILQKLRPTRERYGFSLLNLTALSYTFSLQLPSIPCLYLHQVFHSMTCFSPLL